MKRPQLLATIALAGIFVLCSCAQPAAPAAPSTPAPAPAQEKPMEISYATLGTINAWGMTHAEQPWFRQIEQATKNKVKIVVYPSETLAKATESVQALKNDVADTAFIVLGMFPGLTPLCDVLTLPFVPFKSAEQGSAIFWKLYQEFPSIQAEVKDLHPLVLFTSTPYFLVNTKREIRSMKDLEGLKIRSVGGPPADMFKALGATPVAMSTFDVYDNLSKGVIDGSVIIWESVYTFRIYELAKYYTYVPLFAATFTVGVSNKTWNKLGPDIQKQIESVSGLEGSKFMGKNMWDSAAAEVRSVVTKGNYTMNEYTLPPAEVDLWLKTAGEPIWKSWIQRMESKGFSDAKKIFDRMFELAKSL